MRALAACTSPTHVVALSVPQLIWVAVLRLINVIFAHGILRLLTPRLGRAAAAPSGLDHRKFVIEALLAAHANAESINLPPQSLADRLAVTWRAPHPAALAAPHPGLLLPQAQQQAASGTAGQQLWRLSSTSEYVPEGASSP